MVASQSCFSYIADMTVAVRAEYNSPPGFHLPSPPYYRPASSLGLRCNVQGAMGPVSYHWTTTSTTSTTPIFAWMQSQRTISLNRLTVLNVGNYTCSVNDSDGFVVSASTTVTLIGESSPQQNILLYAYLCDWLHV